jgi:hypothetical protein
MKITPTMMAARRQSEIKDDIQPPKKVMKVSEENIATLALALKTRRAELISRPLDRIWPDLAATAALICATIFAADESS